ncbi:MAG: hypothetical protein ACI4U3_06965 [Traorella sp.]
MKWLKKILKHEEKKLLKTTQVNKNIKEYQKYLNFYHIKHSQKTEIDYFYCEALIQTLKNKELIENTFVISYDNMVDYWQTLTYEERKRLINIDIQQAIQNIPHVIRNNQNYYLPIMNDRMNKLYENEMVLFELKQYNRLRFDCKDMIEQEQLSLDLVQYHFTSLEYVLGDENNFYAYCSINETLYHFVDHQIMDSFTLIHISNLYDLDSFIDFYENKDEINCINYVIEKKMISDKMIKKVTKKLERRK